jgi:ribosome assembly protein SQT1
MEGDKKNDDKNNNKENEEFDPEENKDQVNEINGINENEENMFINPEDIQEIEEIDKDALKAEMGEEMDIDDNIDLGNNNKDNNDENKANCDNNNEDADKEEEDYHKEYENFKTKGEIYAINFHQSSGTLIIGDGEDTTYFFNLDKKELIKEEKLNTDSVNFIKFSSDNKYMLTTSVDGSVNIFNVSKNFELINTIKDQDTEINWVEWHPKGPAFAFGTAEGAIWVYMATNIKNNFNFYSHNEACTCGMFLDDGKKLISGGEDATVKIYELKEKKIEFTIKGKKFIQNPITCIDICKSKAIAVCCSISNEFCLINYQNGNILYYRQYPSTSQENACSIENVCFCYDDQYITFADSENHLNIFEMKSMSLRSSITVHGDNLTKIVPSKKKTYEVYCSGSNGYLYVFDTRGMGTIVLREKCHSDVIMDFIVTENENFVITSSIDKTINLIKTVDIQD